MAREARAEAIPYSAEDMPANTEPPVESMLSRRRGNNRDCAHKGETIMKTHRRAFLPSVGCASLSAALLPTPAAADIPQKPEKRLGLVLSFPNPKPGQGIDATIGVGKLFSYTVSAVGGG